MKQDEMLQMQTIQRTFLHDAAQSLEIDADDEDITADNFGLVFDSHRRAIAVARLAVENFYKANNTDWPFANQKCNPSVMLNGNKYVASIRFLDNTR